MTTNMETAPRTLLERARQELEHKTAFYDAIQSAYPGITTQGVLSSLKQTITDWPRDPLGVWLMVDDA